MGWVRGPSRARGEDRFQLEHNKCVPLFVCVCAYVVAVGVGG